MEGRVFILSAWMCLFLLIPGGCDGNIQECLERLDILEGKYLDLKVDIVSNERTLVKRVSRTKKSLRNEMKKTLKKQIIDNLPDIISSELVADLIKSQVILETRHLSELNHQLKRQLKLMKTSLNRIELDRMYQDSLYEGKKDNTVLVTCSDCLESNIMTSKLTVFNDSITELTNQVLHLNTLQHEHVGESRGSVKASMSVATTSSSSLSSTYVAASSTIQNSTSTSSTTSASTTTTSHEEKTRILVMPSGSGTPLQVRQINIQSKVVTNYSNLKLFNVFEIVHVSKLNSLLIAQRNPNRILSSRLDSSTTEILKYGVGAYSLAVDEERDLVFLSIYVPTKRVSRMDLNGEKLIDILNLSSNPWTIVVNSRTRTLYVTLYEKLLSLSYDGDNVVTLDTGSYIYAASLDISKGYLYYNNGKEIYRHHISQNTTTKIRRLSFSPINLKYYRDTIYYSSFWSPGRVASLDLNINVTQKLKTWGNYNDAIICLVPGRK